MATLAGIYVYPIKALDGNAVETVTIAEGGSLRPDRQFALVDDDGEYVNGKRTPDVHRISADFDASGTIVTLADDGDTTRFDLDAERDAARRWLDERFDPSISFVRDEELGFPDDTTDFGPTIISTGTLETVADWFDEIENAAEMRRRLRPNLVVEAEPFWEDRLYAGPGEAVRFEIGTVAFEGISPCQRCVVPTRHPDTAETIENFQQTFVENRERTLPSWADERQFDHYYRVMVNTRTPEESRGKAISIGDEVVIGDTVADE